MKFYEDLTSKSFPAKAEIAELLTAMLREIQTLMLSNQRFSEPLGALVTSCQMIVLFD